MSNDQSPTPSVGRWFADVLKPPAKMLFFGLVVLLLIHLGGRTVRGWGLPALDLSTNGAAVVVGILVFVLGIGLVAFLWWLVGRFFRLLDENKSNEATIAALKELPLGLPEGTVRAILALIVGMVGIPLLLFSNALHLSDAVLGYINGIVIGVFSFYFGSKTSGVPTSAVQSMAASAQTARAAEARATQAEEKADQQSVLADAASRATQFLEHNTKFGKHAQLASILLKDIVPLLPPGTIPQSAIDTLAKANTLLAIFQSTDKDHVTAEQLSQIVDLGSSLLGNETTASPLKAMLQAAGPMLQGIAIPGLGQAAGVAALLSMGYNLASAGFVRWRTTVLGVKLASGVINFGTVTPDEMAAAIDRSPKLKAALQGHGDLQDFAGELVDLLARPDGTELALKRYGPEGATPLFASREGMIEAVAEVNHVLLEARLAHDIPDTLPASVAKQLSNAAPELRVPPDTLNTPADAMKLIRAVAPSDGPNAPPVTAQAAFDALITVAGVARQNKIDLASILAEIK